MADLYVDQSLTNGTGAGTEGDPYGDIQQAIDAWTTSVGRIWIKGTADALGSSLSWASFAGGTTLDTPLVFQGWDEVADFDGNNNTTIFSTTSIPTSVICIDCKFRNTSSYLIDPPSLWLFIRCEFTDGQGVALVDGAANCNFLWCNFHDDGGSSVDAIEAFADCLVIGCRFANISGSGVTRASGTPMHIIGCLFVEVEEDNISFTNQDMCVVIGCTFHGDGVINAWATTENAASEWQIIYNNIVKDMGGASDGGGFENVSGHAHAIFGSNHFNGNRSDYGTKNVVGLDLTSEDESTDPGFADDTNATVSSRNYTPGSSASGKGHPGGRKWAAIIGGDLTEDHPDMGAVQREPGGAIVLPRRKSVR